MQKIPSILRMFGLQMIRRMLVHGTLWVDGNPSYRSAFATSGEHKIGGKLPV